MQELVSAVPVLAGLIEKGGVIGVLIFVMIFLVRDLLAKRKELLRVYKQRDRWRILYVKFKAATDAAGIKVDASGLDEIDMEET